MARSYMCHASFIYLWHGPCMYVTCLVWLVVRLIYFCFSYEGDISQIWCIYIYVYRYIHTYTYTFIYTYVYIYIYTCDIYTYIYINIYTRTRKYIHTNIHIWTYIYIKRENAPFYLSLSIYIQMRHVTLMKSPCHTNMNESITQMNKTGHIYE